MLYKLLEEDFQDNTAAEPEQLQRAKQGFEVVRRKLIVDAPILQNFEPINTGTIIVYVNGWAIFDVMT